MRSTGGGASYTGTRHLEPRSHRYPRSFRFARRAGDRNLVRDGDWEGGPDGLASAPGRSGTGSSLCLDRDPTRMGSRERFPAVSRPDHTGTGSSWYAWPDSFPERSPCCPCLPVLTRDRVPAIPLFRYRSETGSPAIPLSRYRTGRGRRRPSVLVLVRDGVPSIPLLRHRTGRAPCCLHHPSITPVLHPPLFSAAPPALSVPVSGGDYPGGPESPAFGSIPPAGLCRGTPNRRVKRIAGVYNAEPGEPGSGLRPGNAGEPGSVAPGGICSRGVQDNPEGMFTQTSSQSSCFPVSLVLNSSNSEETTTGHSKHYSPRGETEARAQVGITGGRIPLRSPTVIWGTACSGFPPDPKPTGGRGGAFPGPAA